MSVFTNYHSSDPILPRAGSRFPRHLPLVLLSAALNEAENNIQAPRPLILSGALTAISLACQGLIDVCKPNGQRTPASLMLLSIAESGERKTTAENIFLSPIRDFQKLESARYQEFHSEWSARMDAWKAKKNAILKSLSKSVISGVDSSESELVLIAHEKTKPVKPRQFKMIYEDSTSEALFSGLHQNLRTAGLISSEGGGVLNGRALNDLSKQNALWSGDSITVDRASVDSYEIQSARLTVSIMVQDQSFKSYMEHRGEKSRGSGLWARFLVCRPRSTQGTRTISNGIMSWEHCSKFAERITEILKKNLYLLDEPDKARDVVSFSPEAVERWLEVFNEIELGIRIGGRFSEMADLASKLADNIARVAALFHYFEGAEGLVSCDTLDAAIDLCCWYSDEFFDIFIPPPEEETDSAELEAWIRAYIDDGRRLVPKNIIRQYGPNKLRGKQRLERALGVLQDKGIIDYLIRGKTTYVKLVGLPPKILYRGC